MGFPIFQGGARGTLGVELELQIIDAETLALQPDADRLLAAVPDVFRDAVKPEYYRCCIEINTDVCRDVDEVGLDLAPKIRAIEEAAGRLGLRIGWGGTHPFSRWHEQLTTQTPRYRQIEETFQDTLRRQMTFGLHVHVGVEDGDAAARACDRMRAQLPALMALAANSPLWCGRPTGMQSHRAEVLSCGPTNGLAPRMGDWASYAGMIDRLVNSGCIFTPKDLWWDLRPSPQHGTVEVRACDMPADLATVQAIVALIQCLIVEGSAIDGPQFPADEAATLMLRQNRWRASRHGLDAELVDLGGGPTVPARQAIRGMVQRLASTAETLGCSEALGRAAALADGPTGAERQLAVLKQTRSPAEVVRLLIGDRRPDPADSAVPTPDVFAPWASQQHDGPGLVVLS